jgi:hypothetical protein
MLKVKLRKKIAVQSAGLIGFSCLIGLGATLAPFFALASVSQSPYPASGSSEFIPVYLRTNSQFPSGHNSRQLLENRNRKYASQRWFKVETKDKAHGWIAEDDSISALKLVNQAKLTEATNLYSERSNSALEKHALKAGDVVRIIDIMGSWALVRTSIRPIGIHDAWIPTQKLTPVLPPAANVGEQKFFLTHTTNLFALPNRHGAVDAQIPASTIVVLVPNQALSNEWLEVQTKLGKGYVLRSEAVAAVDLGPTGLKLIEDSTPLRAAPFPDAPTIRHLATDTQLKMIDQHTLRWGFAKVPELGEVWWPTTHYARANSDMRPAAEHIKNRELFRRKIFDMASSPLIPQLKFASAQGVYRTTDNEEWTKIQQFEDKNYPIAIAGEGTVFVGQFMSEDQGETFREWIRWDSLVDTIRRNFRISPRSMRIQEIRPEDPKGQRVILRLSVGDGGQVKLLTENQGRTWRVR